MKTSHLIVAALAVLGLAAVAKRKAAATTSAAQSPVTAPVSPDWWTYAGQWSGAVG